MPDRNFDKSIKILVVDDSEPAMLVLVKVLRELGYTSIVTKDDGQEALWFLKQDPEGKSIGLVISDWHMPNMNGLDFLKEVRGRKETEGLPFILLTSDSDNAPVLDAVRAGASSFAAKPVTAAIFEVKMAAAYKKHH